MGHFSLAQDHAIGKLFTDDVETVPLEDLIDPLLNEIVCFVEDLWLTCYI